TWSACRTMASGTVSRCGTPVIFSTTSLSDSRCWMLTVEMTSMPASSSSSTSCQRLALREPGTLVCASSSTSATSGLRASTACRRGVGVHFLEAGAAVGQPGPRHDFQPFDQLGGVLAPVGLHEAYDHVGAAFGPPVALAQHVVGLAHAGRVTEIDPEFPPVVL